MTRFLIEQGHEVTHYNRNRAQVVVPESVRHIVGDRTDYSRFAEQMREAGDFDCVIDMICYDPKEAESLISVFAGRVAHLIVCSTVDVYCKPPLGYPIQDNAPHAPAPWDYAVKKAQLEAILAEANLRGDLPVTIVRPAFTYGEGRGLVHSLGGKTTYFDRLLKGKPLVVHGDGSSFWVSCHCEDVARAFVGAVGNPRTFGKGYNVTGEEWMTWNRYHELVAESIAAPPPNLVHIPTDVLASVAKRGHICAVNFQYNNLFDNSMAKRDLGFAQTISFREGVSRIFDWLVAHDRIENSDNDPYDDRILRAWELFQTRLTQDLVGVDV